MIVQKKVDLSQRTTMKIGGYAKLFYIPETEQELISVVKKIYTEKGHLLILSGGSNLLINDDKWFDEVIYMGSACSEMSELGEGKFYIGASNRIQKVISFVNCRECGGFEQLIGLPALFGGIVYMNAGIGDEKNSLFTIGQFIESVKVYDLHNDMVLELPADKCDFSHRHSIFHNQQYVILGATIQCKKISFSEAEKVKEARLKYCKEKFEYGKGCFGTCFSTVNYKIIKFVYLYDKIRKLGKKRVTFGKNNRNWLVNHGNGKYKDAMKIINMCKLMHKLCFKKLKCEIVIWN